MQCVFEHVKKVAEAAYIIVNGTGKNTYNVNALMYHAMRGSDPKVCSAITQTVIRDAVCHATYAWLLEQLGRQTILHGGATSPNFAGGICRGKSAWHPCVKSSLLLEKQTQSDQVSRCSRSASQLRVVTITQHLPFKSNKCIFYVSPHPTFLHITDALSIILGE